MPKTRSRIRNCFRGAFLGAAVADALGFPHQGLSRGYLGSLALAPTDQYRRHPLGQYPVGQYSATTQTTLAVADAVLEAQDVHREIVAERLIPLWRDLLVVDADPGSTAAMRRLVKGQVTAAESGHDGGHAESGPLGRALVVGLWDFRNPDRVPAHAEAVLGITHRDPRVLAAGSGLAAAVVHNLSEDELVLGVFLDRIAAAAGHFHGQLADAVLDFPRVLSQTTPRALRILESVCLDERHATSEEDGLSEYVVPAFLAAVYHFLKSPHDYDVTVESCLRLGGLTCPTLAAAGALVGSLNGIQAIPAGLAHTVLESEQIVRRADALLDLSPAAKNVRARAPKRD